MVAVAKPPRKGDVVVVSAAAGGVGSLAAQIAKARGATVIGIAGGPRKQEYLLNDLHLDGAVDYKSQEASVEEQLDRLAPQGIDFFFDNVGGATLDAALARIRPKGRVVICGAISQYDGSHVNKGTVEGPKEYLKLAERGATMKGYNVMQYMPGQLPAFLCQMLPMGWRGKLKMHEHWETGLERFPSAIELMYNGGHVGKLLVKVKSS